MRHKRYNRRRITDTDAMFHCPFFDAKVSLTTCRATRREELINCRDCRAYWKSEAGIVEEDDNEDMDSYGFSY